MSPSERMSPVDTTWLRMDRPNNLMTIVGVMVLEGPVRIARLEKTLAERMLAYPRFRQRAVVGPAGAFKRCFRHRNSFGDPKRDRLEESTR